MAESARQIAPEKEFRTLVSNDVYVLGLPFWNATYEEFNEWWNAVLARSSGPGVVLAFANANTLNHAAANRQFRSALENADLLVNDGIGFRLASKMRGVETRYNLNGTDLVPRLLSELTKPTRVCLYGATEDSNRLAADALAKYENVEIVERVNGYVDPENEAIPRIAACKPDILLVALGHPRQEIFCVENKERLGAKVLLPVGGLFDFLSETKARAPQWMRRSGLEWVYRFSLEPGRMFSRYVLGNPVFLIRSLLNAPKDRAIARK